MANDSFYDTQFNSCKLCEDLIQSDDGVVWSHIDNTVEHKALPRDDLQSMKVPNIEPGKLDWLMDGIRSIPLWLLPIVMLIGLSAGLVAAMVAGNS